MVSSTIFYGCGTWTLRLDQQRLLRAVQRKMLRLVLNAKRFKIEHTSSQSSSDNDVSDVDLLEPWPDFLGRTARWTQQTLEKTGQKNGSTHGVDEGGDGQANLAQLTPAGGAPYLHSGIHCSTPAALMGDLRRDRE